MRRFWWINTSSVRSWKSMPSAMGSMCIFRESWSISSGPVFTPVTRSVSIRRRPFPTRCATPSLITAFVSERDSTFRYECCNQRWIPLYRLVQYSVYRGGAKGWKRGNGICSGGQSAKLPYRTILKQNHRSGNESYRNTLCSR